MSSDAIGWVFKFSPYEGANRLCHLAIADSANDQNDYEMWMSVTKLARKAGCSESSARRALQQLADEGFLEVVETRPGQTTRYRMLMPKVPLRYHPRGKDGDPEQVFEGVAPRDPYQGDRGDKVAPQGFHGETPGVSPRDPNPRRTQEEPNRYAKSDEKVGFEGGRRKSQITVERTKDLLERERQQRERAAAPPWKQQGLTYREWLEQKESESPTPNLSGSLVPFTSPTRDVEPTNDPTSKTTSQPSPDAHDEVSNAGSSKAG